MSSPLFTPTTLTDSSVITMKAADWYSTVVKPTSDAVGVVLGDTALPVEPVGLLNGWSAYTFSFAPASGYLHPAWMTNGTLVQLQGLVTGGTSGSAANAIFVLPPALRPLKTHGFEVIAGTGGANLIVDANGNVWVASYNNTGSNSFVALDSVSFWTD